MAGAALFCILFGMGTLCVKFIIQLKKSMRKFYLGEIEDMKKRYLFCVLIGLLLVITAGCSRTGEDSGTGEKDRSQDSLAGEVATPSPKADSVGGTMEISGSKLVRYHWRESGESVVEFPLNVTSIGKKAFRIRKPKGKYEKIHLEIPKDVKLKKCAFQQMGPAEITFEEGRKRIERDAFYWCGVYDSEITVILPKSLRVLEESAFSQLGSNNVHIQLNEGLREVEDGALMCTNCDLPSTVKKLGNYALSDAWYPEHGYVLPEKLEEMGNHCIAIPGGWDPDTPIRIPASVKKIGRDIIEYESITEHTCGVKVDKANPYFKSDERGWLYSKDGKILYHAYIMGRDTVIPSHVEKIKCTIQMSEESSIRQPRFKNLFPNEKLKQQYLKKHPEG